MNTAPVIRSNKAYQQPVGPLAGSAIGGPMNRRNLLKGLAAAPILIAPVWRVWAAAPSRGAVSVEELQKHWKDFLAQGGRTVLVDRSSG